MSRLILAFVDIALHRRGPEDLPASAFLLGLALIVYLAVASFAVQLVQPGALALGMIVVDAAVLLLFLRFVLGAFGLERRLLQTATAIVGAEALFTALSLPLRAMSAPVGPEAPVAGAVDLPAFLLLLLVVWSVDVSGFVLSRAIERPYAVGLTIMLGYILLSIGLWSAVFPASR